jgi:hypothetical protein
MAQKKSGFWKDVRVFLIVFPVLFAVVIIGRDCIYPVYSSTFTVERCFRCPLEKRINRRVILWIPLLQEVKTINSGTEGCEHTIHCALGMSFD